MVFSQEMMSPDIVYYHDGCADGKAGAWIFHRKYPTACFVGLKAGSSPTDTSSLTDKHVVFVDVCPPTPDAIREILRVAASVLIVDHHETSKRTLESLKDEPKLTVIYDESRCGAALAWDLLNTTPRPWFVDYIDDRDRWVWKLPRSKEINAGMFEGGWQTFEGFNKLVADESLCEKLYQDGKFIMTIEEKEIRVAVSSAVEATLKNRMGDSWRVWLGTAQPKLRSELGNRLAKKPFADGTMPAFSATWVYNPPTDEWWISLRGSESSPSLVDITGTLPNGGGHLRAAGFTIPAGEHLRDYFSCSGASTN